MTVDDLTAAITDMYRSLGDRGRSTPGCTPN